MRSDGFGRWVLVGAALVWGLLTLRVRPPRGSALAPVATPERLRAAGLLSLALLLVAAPAAIRAQEAPAQGGVVAPSTGITALGVAHYDPGGRRDPFVPLFEQAAGGVSGPRFDTLKLTGVFLGRGANSLAVLEDPSHRGYFVRLGQSIGNARLVEILPQAAVFEVQEYGASRRVVLRLERTEESP